MPTVPLKSLHCISAGSLVAQIVELNSSSDMKEQECVAAAAAVICPPISDHTPAPENAKLADTIAEMTLLTYPLSHNQPCCTCKWYCTALLSIRTTPSSYQDTACGAR